MYKNGSFAVLFRNILRITLVLLLLPMYKCILLMCTIVYEIKIALLRLYISLKICFVM
jgi:hypothetical protein